MRSSCGCADPGLPCFVGRDPKPISAWWMEVPVLPVMPSLLAVVLVLPPGTLVTDPFNVSRADVCVEALSWFTYKLSIRFSPLLC